MDHSHNNGKKKKPIETTRSLLGDASGSIATPITTNTPISVSTNPAQMGVLTDGTSIIVPKARVSQFGTATTSYAFSLNKTPDATGTDGINDKYSFNIPFTTTAPANGNWNYVINVWDSLNVILPNSDFDIWSYTLGGIDTDQQTDGYPMGNTLFAINVANEVHGTATPGQVVSFTHSINYHVPIGIAPLMAGGQWDLGQGEVTVLWIPA